MTAGHAKACPVVFGLGNLLRVGSGRYDLPGNCRGLAMTWFGMAGPVAPGMCCFRNLIPQNGHNRSLRF